MCRPSREHRSGVPVPCCWLFAMAMAIAASGPATAAPPASGTAIGTAGPTREAASAVPRLPAGMSRIAEVEGITEYALPNGLHVLTLPDASKPVTTVNLTVRVGSRMESYGETGMAHLLEHLMFKGTPGHPNPGREMGDRGLSWNGTTSYDRTNYFASMAESPANLEFYLGWLAEALTQSNIARKDLDSEMTVVRNEMESGENNAGRILLENVVAAAFQWHNYGKSTIGARSDVENVDIPALQAFYRKYYQPDQATVIVTGKFDEARTLAVIAAAFGKIPKPSRVLAAPYTLDPVQDGERAVTLRRAGETPLLMALYHVPAGSAPDFAPLTLATMILGGPDFRLGKALIDGRLAAGAAGAARALAEPGFAVFSAVLKADQSLDAAREVFVKTIEGVAEKPFTAAELERAKNVWLRAYTQTQTDPQRVGIALSEYVALGDWRLGFDRRDRIKAATLAEVNRAAVDYFVTSNRTLGTFVPSPNVVRAPAPARVDVASVLKEFKGGEAMAAGESFDVSPDNIERRTQLATLPGAAAVRTVLLPKATRGGKVIATITLRLGDEKSLFGREMAGVAMARLLAAGSERIAREQLATAFEKLQASWSVGGNATGVQFRIETTKANLGPALELAFDVLRAPRFRSGLLDQLRVAWVTGIESARADPRALLLQRLEQHANVYPKGDIRYPLSHDEQLAEINALRLDDLRAFHRDFYGASSAIVTVIGDFDAAAITAQLQKGLGDWVSRTPYVRVPRPVHEIAPAQFRIEVKDKQNAVAEAQLELALRDTDREFQALRLATQMFGGSGGSSGRLWERIRGKEGLSYSVGASLSGGQYNAHAGWSFRAIAAPQNMERVKAVLDEEIARARRDGFSADELARAKEAMAAASRLGRAQDTALAGTLAAFAERDKTPRFLAEIENLREQITLDEVNAAFRKYVQADKMVFGAAGDFANARGAVVKTAAPS